MNMSEKEELQQELLILQKQLIDKALEYQIKYGQDSLAWNVQIMVKPESISQKR